MARSFDERVTRMASLGEPIRRALYRFVTSRRGSVTRDQAAEGVGVPRHVAKFHLDKLEEDGLLVAEFSRDPGRGGPGAGRPSKRYRRSESEIAVSLPERRYDLAGQLMARAITIAERDGTPVSEALSRVARDVGRSLGEEARERVNVSGDSPEAATGEMLEACGYEPRSEGGEVTLENCPFHALAQEHTELVCGMNLDLLSGFLVGLGSEDVEAHLEPAPDRCCVVLRSAGETNGRAARDS